MNDATANPPKAPPQAAKKPSSVSHHGLTVSDDYAWLRDPGYPEVTDKAVLDHLKAENAWFEARMAGQQGRIRDMITLGLTGLGVSDGDCQQILASIL